MNLVADYCQRLSIKNPWEQGRFTLPYDPHGWFPKECQRNLELILTRSTSEPFIAIELGSWLGRSTRLLAKWADLVIAVDHWRGSPEHQRPSNQGHTKLPTLYEQFMANCREHRDRILPLRMATLEAAALPLPKADLIYVDAGHEFEAVAADLRAYWPHLKDKGVLCGDDAQWGSAKGYPVRRAVEEFAEATGTRAMFDGQFWRVL